MAKEDSKYTKEQAERDAKEAEARKAEDQKREESREEPAPSETTSEETSSEPTVDREEFQSVPEPKFVDRDSDIDVRPKDKDFDPKNLDEFGKPRPKDGSQVIINDPYHPHVVDDDKGGPKGPDECNPPCAPGQSYYADPTSSTGFRSCTTCGEVSVQNPYLHLDCEELEQLFLEMNAQGVSMTLQQKEVFGVDSAYSFATVTHGQNQVSINASTISIAPSSPVAKLSVQNFGKHSGGDPPVEAVIAHHEKLIGDLHNDVNLIIDALEANDCSDEEGCKPSKFHCASPPLGLGQSYYPDPNSPTGYSSCQDCTPVDPKDECDPPCTDGQPYYLDPTSSTGYRSCLDCLEVSPIDDGDDGINVHGDIIDINPINDDTVFSGTIYQPQTLTYNEQVKGWTSFKTFYPENALSINNHYYTYSGGEMWQHHLNPRRNNFYGTDANSTVDLIFNDAPSSVKGFQTVKYEGTQSRVLKFSEVVRGGITYTDKEYYNLTAKPGWYVSHIETDLQTGKVPEFVNKEGKWFNAIKGDCTQLENVDEREFSVQGVGFGSLTHSEPESESPAPVRIEIQIKDSGSDIDGTLWD